MDAPTCRKAGRLSSAGPRGCVPGVAVVRSLTGEKEHRYPVEFEPPQIPKSFGAGLNIPTTLHIYGYQDVWELDPVVDPNRTVIEFESEAPAQKAGEW